MSDKQYAPNGYSLNPVYNQEQQQVAQFTVQVQIPEGSYTGQVLNVQGPQGQPLQVSTPPNASPGQIIPFIFDMPPQQHMMQPMSLAPSQPIAGIGNFQPLTNLMVKQTRKGCMQNFCGCDAQNEFKISTAETPHDYKLYALEESDFLARCCLPFIHPFRMNVSTGGIPGGYAVSQYDRPFACAPGPCKCCCYQSISATDPNTNKYLGNFKETQYCCVPIYEITDTLGNPKYNVHMPRCCGGMCIDCNQSRRCCLPNFIPFQVYNIVNGVEDEENPVGMIAKKWAGLGNEILDADQFDVTFPPDADNEMKATLTGGVFLFKEIYFQAQKQSGGASLLALS
jgi:hypothetical protein